MIKYKPTRPENVESGQVISNEKKITRIKDRACTFMSKYAMSIVNCMVVLLY